MPNLLLDPDLWKGGGDETPPTEWTGSAYSYQSSEVLSKYLYLQYSSAVDAGDKFSGSVTFDSLDFDTAFLNLVSNTDVVIDSVAVGATPTNFEFDAVADARFVLGPDAMSAGAGYYGVNCVITPSSAPVPKRISYNCECEEDDPAAPRQTLAELRRRMMIRLGFAASADNPPPGKLLEIDDYLQSAQRFLYQKVASFRQKRMFRWPLVEGVRFYDLGENDDACTKPMLAETVEWVGISRGGQLGVGQIEPDGEEWSRLICGISPDLYSGGIQNSCPTHYEIRQCIEVWPAPGPDAGYLRIKANFGIGRFTEPTDKTTIDSELVFNFALARARMDAGKLGAKDYDALVQSMIGDINAGSHHTRRYVPGSYIESVPPQPIMKDGWLP